MLGDITLLVVILYLLEALLLLAHALRHRAGLFPVCMVIATLVFFMMITDPFHPEMLGPGGMILSVNSLTIFPTVLLGVLLVYITEGPRATWILFGCLLGVYALSLAAQALVQLWLQWPGLLAPEIIPAQMFPISVTGHLRSAVAMAVDVAVITGIFKLLTRRVPDSPAWAMVWAAFAIALVTDGIVYPLLLRAPQLIIQQLPGQAIGKLAVSVLMSLPMIPYLRRINPRWLQEEIVGVEHFDLFQASGDLRRSLQMSERRFRQIIDQSPSAIIGFNHRGRVILWNPAAEAIYGPDPARAQGRPAAEFLCDGSVEQLREVNRRIERVFEGKSPEDGLQTTFERAGRRRHLSGSLFPLRGVGGEILFGVATMHDITRLTEIEKSLSRTKERLELVVDSIREGMAVVDHGSRIQVWNRAAAKLTGLSADQVIGHPLREALPDFLGAPAPAGAIERALTHAESDTLEHIAGPGAGSRVYEVRLLPYSRGVTIFFSEVMLGER
jgi:PAS domain S-box-containing protein